MGLLRFINSIPLVSKFARFVVVGASGMVVDYGFLIIFKELLSFPEWLSLAIAFVLAATSNYILNRVWTFKSHNKQVGREYSNFLIISIVGLGITELTVFLFGEFEWTQAVIGNSYKPQIYFYINKFIAIVITTLWNFFGNMFITFRNRNASTSADVDNAGEASGSDANASGATLTEEGTEVKALGEEDAVKETSIDSVEEAKESDNSTIE